MCRVTEGQWNGRCNGEIRWQPHSTPQPARLILDREPGTMGKTKIPSELSVLPILHTHRNSSGKLARRTFQQAAPDFAVRDGSVDALPIAVEFAKRMKDTPVPKTEIGRPPWDAREPCVATIRILRRMEGEAYTAIDVDFNAQGYQLYVGLTRHTHVPARALFLSWCLYLLAVVSIPTVILPAFFAMLAHYLNKPRNLSMEENTVVEGTPELVADVLNQVFSDGGYGGMMVRRIDHPDTPLGEMIRIAHE